MLSGLQLFGQNEPFINLGGSYPIFFKSSLSNDNDYQGKTWISGYIFFTEKPELFERERKKKFWITPGLFYSCFSEKKKSPTGALGGSGSGEYKHKSFGIYNKFLFELTSFSYQSSMIYSGVLAGTNIYSLTKGNEYRRIYSNPPYYWSSKTNGNGKLFYSSLIIGLIAGIKPNYDDSFVLKPALELTFYPYYAKLLDYYTDREDLTEHNSMLSISLIFGFGTKKP
jgi:hypothetical protein